MCRARLDNIEKNLKVLTRDFEKYCSLLDSCTDVATRVKESLDSFTSIAPAAGTFGGRGHRRDQARADRAVSETSKLAAAVHGLPKGR